MKPRGPLPKTAGPGGEDKLPDKLVCIDCRYIGARPSGIAEVVRGLVDHVPPLAPDLRFLLLVSREAERPLSTAPNVAERVVPYAANGPATMWLLPRLVQLSGVSLFHATFNILPAGLEMPSVTTIHDVMWLKHPRWAAGKGLRGRVDAAFYGHGIRRALARSTRIAAVSRATADEIAGIAPEAAARTRVILSGVSEEFRPLAPGELEALPPPAELAGRRFVLTVGQFSPYKNQERALEAFALAFGDRPDVHQVFVQRRGEGERLLRPQAEALGLSGRVHFLSGLGRAELVALYNRALLLSHPSLYEGFGNPLAEAMACGCPVVTSAVSAMPEVTGGAALLADPLDAASVAQALRRVAGEPGLADRLRRRGLERAQSLSWRRFAETNLAIYRELL